MLIVLRLRNPELIYAPHSTSDRLPFQICPLPLVVYTCHRLMASYCLVNNFPYLGMFQYLLDNNPQLLDQPSEGWSSDPKL